MSGNSLSSFSRTRKCKSETSKGVRGELGFGSKDNVVVKVTFSRARYCVVWRGNTDRRIGRIGARIYTCFLSRDPPSFLLPEKVDPIFLDVGDCIFLGVAVRATSEYLQSSERSIQQHKKKKHLHLWSILPVLA